MSTTCKIEIEERKRTYINIQVITKKENEKQNKNKNTNEDININNMRLFPYDRNIYINNKIIEENIFADRKVSKYKFPFISHTAEITNIPIRIIKMTPVGLFVNIALNVLKKCQRSNVPIFNKMKSVGCKSKIKLFTSKEQLIKFSIMYVYLKNTENLNWRGCRSAIGIRKFLYKYRAGLNQSELNLIDLMYNILRSKCTVPALDGREKVITVYKDVISLPLKHEKYNIIYNLLTEWSLFYKF